MCKNLRKFVEILCGGGGCEGGGLLLHVWHDVDDIEDRSVWGAYWVFEWGEDEGAVGEGEGGEFHGDWSVEHFASSALLPLLIGVVHAVLLTRLVAHGG